MASLDTLPAELRNDIFKLALARGQPIRWCAPSQAAPCAAQDQSMKWPELSKPNSITNTTRPNEQAPPFWSLLLVNKHTYAEASPLVSSGNTVEVEEDEVYAVPRNKALLDFTDNNAANVPALRSLKYNLPYILFPSDCLDSLKRLKNLRELILDFTYDALASCEFGAQRIESLARHLKARGRLEKLSVRCQGLERRYEAAKNGRRSLVDFEQRIDERNGGLTVAGLRELNARLEGILRGERVENEA